MADEVNLRNLALDVIVSVMDKGAYSDKAIHAALEKHPGLEKRDRAFFTRLCQGTIEYEMCIRDRYNADGSEGAMCGNGIRCVAKYVYDKGLTDKKNLSIETKSGIKKLELTVEDGKVSLVKVNMGAPILKSKDIPVAVDTDKCIDADINVDGKVYKITCVSMGNPHAVTFIDEDVNKFPLDKIGPKFENHPMFPDRVNTEFVQVLNRHEVNMRVWERGSGAVSYTHLDVYKRQVKDKSF